MSIEELSPSDVRASLGLGVVLTHHETGIDYRVIGYEPGGRVIFARQYSPETMAALRYLDVPKLRIR